MEELVREAAEEEVDCQSVAHEVWCCSTSVYFLTSFKSLGGHGFI